MEHDDEYVEDPDEITPCLICGDPIPNRLTCGCMTPDDDRR